MSQIPINLTIDILLGEISLLQLTNTNAKLKKRLKEFFDNAKDVQSIIKYELESKQIVTEQVVTEQVVTEQIVHKQVEIEQFKCLDTHNVQDKKNYNINYPDELTNNSYITQPRFRDNMELTEQITRESYNAINTTTNYTHIVDIDNNEMNLQKLTETHRHYEHITNANEFINKKFYYTTTNFTVQYLYKLNKYRTYYICSDKKLYEIVESELVPAIWNTHPQVWKKK